MSNMQTTDKPTLAYLSLGLGIVAIAAFLVPIAAWILGAAGLVTGFLAYRKPGLATPAQIGMAVSFVGILAGVYYFSTIMAG
ncbi:hypothetical protein [Pseudonocardia spirodelae]|uniref:DUF4190 domain-containing protein n=1 Tax=Pseudonocardia spirodelae TaxID=3133431 RepID=A0ABU8TDS8_9PSEU